MGGGRGGGRGLLTSGSRQVRPPLSLSGSHGGGPLFPPRRRPPDPGGAPPPRGPWHSRLSPALPGSLFSGSPWPPRAGFTCQRRFRPEQKTRPLTASPGARLPWRRRPRGQAASNHSCWIRLVRALMRGAQTQRHPAGARGLLLPGASFPPARTGPPSWTQDPGPHGGAGASASGPHAASIRWPGDLPPWRQGAGNSPSRPLTSYFPSHLLCPSPKGNADALIGQ